MKFFFQSPMGSSWSGNPQIRFFDFLDLRLQINPQGPEKRFSLIIFLVWQLLLVKNFKFITCGLIWSRKSKKSKILICGFPDQDEPIGLWKTQRLFPGWIDVISHMVVIVKLNALVLPLGLSWLWIGATLIMSWALKKLPGPKRILRKIRLFWSVAPQWLPMFVI